MIEKFSTMGTSHLAHFSRVHGQNIRLSGNRTVATYGMVGYNVVYSQNPLSIGQTFALKIREVRIIGTPRLVIGVTSKPPTEWDRLERPMYMRDTWCVDIKPGYVGGLTEEALWECSRDKSLGVPLSSGDAVSVTLNSDLTVDIHHNRRLLSSISTDLSRDQPVWFIAELHVKEVEIIQKVGHLKVLCLLKMSEYLDNRDISHLYLPQSLNHHLRAVVLNTNCNCGRC